MGQPVVTAPASFGWRGGAKRSLPAALRYADVSAHKVAADARAVLAQPPFSANKPGTCAINMVDLEQVSRYRTGGPTWLMQSKILSRISSNVFGNVHTCCGRWRAGRREGRTNTGIGPVNGSRLKPSRHILRHSPGGTEPKVRSGFAPKVLGLAARAAAGRFPTY
jgi:hypothetical protein